MEEKKQSVSTTEVRGSPSSQINNNTKRNKNAFPSLGCTDPTNGYNTK